MIYSLENSNLYKNWFDTSISTRIRIYNTYIIRPRNNVNTSERTNRYTRPTERVRLSTRTHRSRFCFGFDVTQRELCVHACASNLTWERVSGALQKEEKHSRGTRLNRSRERASQESHGLPFPSPPLPSLRNWILVTILHYYKIP